MKEYHIFGITEKELEKLEDVAYRNGYKNGFFDAFLVLGLPEKDAQAAYDGQTENG